MELPEGGTSAPSTKGTPNAGTSAPTNLALPVAVHPLLAAVCPLLASWELSAVVRPL